MEKKTTKGEAKAIYDEAISIIRCYNSGTREENERSASHCYSRLLEINEKAKEALSNPGKRLLNDSNLMESLSVSIPRMLTRFCENYKGFYPEPEKEPSNIVSFFS